MNSVELIPAQLLKRKAVVYVRQSTQSQVMTNLESQRRQYDLVDIARQHGFIDVAVIDDDLGRSASGTVARPGFDRLVAWLCAGKVGAVLCQDASRLARNGRDWHHLLELCGLVEARVIDHDGIYNPCQPNDRLLLGMKGSISEFELGVLRTRMLDAAKAKARRGELRLSVPFGYIWHREAGLGLDPDLRLQEVIRLIFTRFSELGSARQVLLSMTADQIHFPRPSDEGRMTNFKWLPIRYRNVISVLKNPFYAGVYVYGKSEKRTSIVDGRARRSYGHSKPVGTWDVFIKDHHEGYIGWDEFERNQNQLALNNYGRADGVKSGRGGRALLAGVMTCARCGRRLSVAYTGNPQSRPVYRHDHGLSIQRHVLGMFGHRDLGQKRLGGPTAFQQMRGGLRLHHTSAPLGAGVFRAHGDDDLIASRDAIQPLAPVLSDPDHVAAAAGARKAVRLDHALDAWQAFGQRTRLAGRSRHTFLRVRFAGRHPLLKGRDLCLGLGDGGFLILQRQFQLRRVQLLGFRPELRAPVIQNLAFQLLDQRLQLGDEGILLGHHSLLMLACCTLDRELELHRGKGLRHLGWKVWKLAEIEGRRHAPSYPIRDKFPIKQRPK